jgi:DNA-binding CsgD family transcriptional regulator
MLSGTLGHEFGRGGAHALDFRAGTPLCFTVTTRQDSATPRNDRVKLLTDGERACLRRVYAHMTSKDIARELGLSNHTVDMRLRTAIKKLDVGNRVEAARLLFLDELSHPAAVGDTDLAIDSDQVGTTDATASIDGAAGAYQPLIYQAPEIAAGANSAMFGAPASAEVGAAAKRSSDPNLLELGSLARTLHSPHRLVADPLGGTLAQPGASAGNTALKASLATDRPGIAAPDPGIDARPFLTTRPWGQRNDLAIGHRLGWILFIAFGSALTFGGVLSAFAALKSLI